MSGKPPSSPQISLTLDFGAEASPEPAPKARSPRGVRARTSVAATPSAPAAPVTAPPRADEAASDGPSTIASASLPVVASAASAPSVEAPSLEASDLPEATEAPSVFTVGRLARLVQGAFDAKFPQAVLVEGEVSGLKRAPSGHVYFALKDPNVDASLDVVAYRNSITPRARELLREGHGVRLRGKFAFYAPRGRTQFLCDRVEPTGEGALLLALERLKAKLQAEGLFDPARKRPLPREPRRIGLVTSRSGAVLHDIRKVAYRRGGARLLLAPALVQGASAVAELCAALAKLQQVADVDVIILARGGGSADDLAAFNDEALVRAVAACRVPIVSAVGHETDVSLTDFAADARAATPSQAAEMVVADSQQQRQQWNEAHTRLLRALHGRIERSHFAIERARRALGDPRLLLARARQRLDEMASRQRRAMERRGHGEQQALQRLSAQLTAAHPRVRLLQWRQQLAAQQTRLGRTIERRAARERALFSARVERLSALSPLSVLGRGYAIVTDTEGRAVRGADEVRLGQRLRLRLARGALEATVQHLVVAKDPEA